VVPVSNGCFFDVSLALFSQESNWQRKDLLIIMIFSEKLVYNSWSAVVIPNFKMSDILDPLTVRL
jgi:hypothetical protein